MKDIAKRLLREEAGQDVVEYALLMALIGLIAVASMQTVGSTIKNIFANAAANLSPSGS
jgi:pilus assembly protein Flp/PilA